MKARELAGGQPDAPHPGILDTDWLIKANPAPHPGILDIDWLIKANPARLPPMVVAHSQSGRWMYTARVKSSSPGDQLWE